MKCPPATRSGHSPAWKKLLLIGTLLACSTCSASLELPLAEGGGGHPPVPGSPDGLRTASRFPGRKAQPAAVVSPEGLRGPAHMGREWLGSRGPLLITNVTARDADSDATVLGTSRGQGRANNSPRQVQLRTSPSAVRGVIYSDLNFSVIMAWTVTMDPEPELTWTLNGRLCGTGENLFIRRLSRELLGTYVCTGRNSQQLLSSYPVTISLPPEPQVDVEPTPAWPVRRDPGLTLTGASAIGLIVAASVGGATLLGTAVFFCMKNLCTDRQR